MVNTHNTEAHLHAGRASLWAIALVAITAVVAGSIFAVQDRTPEISSDLGDALLYDVTSGPLTISFSATGALKSKDQVTIRNELPGKTAIIRIVPEGTQVAKGDVLVELDSSTLENTIIDQQIKVNSSNADVTKSQENLAVVRNQAESDRVKADAELRDAEINLRKYIEGEYPLALHKANAALKLAQSNLEQAASKAKWSRTLSAEGYMTKSEADADRLAFEKSEQEVKTAVIDLQLLENYTRAQKVQELQDKLTQAKLGLERARRKASADIVQAEADQSAKKTENERQKSKLASLEKQLQRTKITAPVAGIVVFPQRNPFNPNAELKEGTEVFERQELIYLPTSTSIIANVQVPEMSVSRLRLDLPASVSIDAMPGRRVNGKVTRIAQFPNREMDWLTRDLKLYNVEVTLDAQSTDLRPGMSCQAEVIIQRMDDVVFVPVQSVVRVGDQPVVFVAAGEKARRVPVTVGLDNNRMVHVQSGLRAGEKVLLSPPLEAGALDAARHLPPTPAAGAPAQGN